MSAPWWTGLPATRLTLSCDGHDHHLEWSAGELAAPDHADVEGELALVALGADPLPCLTNLDRWARHADDLDVLMLASRGPADPLERPDGLATSRGYRTAVANPMRHRRYSYSSLTIGTGSWSYGPLSALGEEADDVTALLRLGSGLPDRLVATVIASWCDRVASATADAELPRLTAALYGRVVASAAAWSGSRDTEVSVAVLPPGDDPSAVLDGDVIRLGLAFHWLRDVWCRGLATVMGRLVLAARPLDEHSWELDAVDPDLTRHALTVRL